MSSSGGVWRKTLVYLGLVEEPEEHDELPEHFGRGDVGRPAPEPAPAARPGEPSNVRPLRTPEPGAAHVRAVDGGNGRATVVAVNAFDDVEQVGARFRGGQPVVLDLTAIDKALARRVLDFVSGLTYALRGRLVPAGQRSFLLVPDGVGLSNEDRRRLEGLGYTVAGGDV